LETPLSYLLYICSGRSGDNTVAKARFAPSITGTEGVGRHDKAKFSTTGSVNRRRVRHSLAGETRMRLNLSALGRDDMYILHNIVQPVQACFWTGCVLYSNMLLCPSLMADPLLQRFLSKQTCQPSGCCRSFPMRSVPRSKHSLEWGANPGSYPCGADGKGSQGLNATSASNCNYST